eukprot:CAMPEP_0182882662 /NCGR_PEP_ID=MMETSP0034_2-20130328/17921_1 /TAXON_ID=156128 /ORGANISM="Nephroselmis pyriformis, Strain CCMP717" /LENGTH=37 /DNA_ID= /DNA_START= /DNA_END= /DNA_ORIENTATION=
MPSSAARVSTSSTAAPVRPTTGANARAESAEESSHLT